MIAWWVFCWWNLIIFLNLWIFPLSIAPPISCFLSLISSEEKIDSLVCLQYNLGDFVVPRVLDYRHLIFPLDISVRSLMVSQIRSIFTKLNLELQNFLSVSSPVFAIWHVNVCYTQPQARIEGHQSAEVFDFLFYTKNRSVHLRSLGRQN